MYRYAHSAILAATLSLGIGGAHAQNIPIAVVGPVTGSLLVKRIRGEWPRPDHGPYFSLGNFGMLVNVIAVVYGGIVAFNRPVDRSAAERMATPGRPPAPSGG